MMPMQRFDIGRPPMPGPAQQAPASQMVNRGAFTSAPDVPNGANQLVQPRLFSQIGMPADRTRSYAPSIL